MWSSNGEIIGVGLNFGIGFNYSYDWYVFLVDSENGNLLSDIKKLQLVKGYDNDILDFSPDCKRVAYCLLNSTVEIWNLSADKLDLVLSNEHSLTLDWSLDGSRIAVGTISSNPAVVFNANTGEKIASIPLRFHESPGFIAIIFIAAFVFFFFINRSKFN